MGTWTTQEELLNDAAKVEMSAAKVWYAGFVEDLKKQGFDFTNPLVLGLIQIKKDSPYIFNRTGTPVNAQFENLWNEHAPRQRMLEETKDSFQMAFMARNEDGSYAQQPQDGDYANWMNDNMLSPENVPAGFILELYHAAKKGNLYITVPGAAVGDNEKLRMCHVHPTKGTSVIAPTLEEMGRIIKKNELDQLDETVCEDIYGVKKEDFKERVYQHYSQNDLLTNRIGELTGITADARFADAEKRKKLRQMQLGNMDYTLIKDLSAHAKEYGKPQTPEDRAKLSKIYTAARICDELRLPEERKMMKNYNIGNDVAENAKKSINKLMGKLTAQPDYAQHTRIIGPEGKQMSWNDRFEVISAAQRAVSKPIQIETKDELGNWKMVPYYMSTAGHGMEPHGVSDFGQDTMLNELKQLAQQLEATNDTIFRRDKEQYKNLQKVMNESVRVLTLAQNEKRTLDPETLARLKDTIGHVAGEYFDYSKHKTGTKNERSMRREEISSRIMMTVGMAAMTKEERRYEALKTIAVKLNESLINHSKAAAEGRKGNITVLNNPPRKLFDKEYFQNTFGKRSLKDLEALAAGMKKGNPEMTKKALTDMAQTKADALMAKVEEPQNQKKNKQRML